MYRDANIYVKQLPFFYGEYIFDNLRHVCW